MVNLDPAAEYFAYNPDVDIRELISIEDVMEDEDLRLGPNGGLVFCMEHLVENFDWLEEAMDPHDDDYFLIGKHLFEILNPYAGFFLFATPASAKKLAAIEKLRLLGSIRPKRRIWSTKMTHGQITHVFTYFLNQ